MATDFKRRRSKGRVLFAVLVTLILAVVANAQSQRVGTFQDPPRPRRSGVGPADSGESPAQRVIRLQNQKLQNQQQIIRQAADDLQNVLQEHLQGSTSDDPPPSSYQRVQPDPTADDPDPSYISPNSYRNPAPSGPGVSEIERSAAQLLDEARQMTADLPAQIPAESSNTVFQQIVSDVVSGSSSPKSSDDVFQQIVSNVGTSSLFDDAVRAGKDEALEQIRQDGKSMVEQAVKDGRSDSAWATAYGAVQALNGATAAMGDVINEVLPEGFLLEKAIHGLSSVAQGSVSLLSSNSTADSIAGSGKALNGLSQTAGALAEAAGMKAAASLFDAGEKTGDLTEAIGKSSKISDQMNSGDLRGADTSFLGAIGNVLDVITGSPGAKAAKIAAAVRDGNENVKQGVEKTKQSWEQREAIQKTGEAAMDRIDQTVDRAKVKQ